MTASNRTNTSNSLIARLAALVIALAALLPQGTMLARDAQSGLIEITICSGVSSRTVLFNPETGEYVDEQGPLNHLASDDDNQHFEVETPKSPCPFAVGGDASMHALAPLCFAGFATASLPSAIYSAPAGMPAGAPLPPRGPPTHA